MSNSRQRQRRRNGVAIQDRKPDLTRPVAENALQAEATGANVAFQWEGTTFVVDLANLQFDKAMFALRVASNDALPVATRMNLMIDVFEVTLGADQLATLYEAAPDMFSNSERQQSFWIAFTQAVTGAAPGESQAS
jgi:hypothetical protein